MALGREKQSDLGPDMDSIIELPKPTRDAVKHNFCYDDLQLLFEACDDLMDCLKAWTSLSSFFLSSGTPGLYSTRTANRHLASNQLKQGPQHRQLKEKGILTCLQRPDQLLSSSEPYTWLLANTLAVGHFLYPTTGAFPLRSLSGHAPQKAYTPAIRRPLPLQGTAHNQGSVAVETAASL